MGILDFLTDEFVDVIHWTDDTRDTMVWRFEREDHEIKYGAKLTVREGQAAVIVHEGQLADVFAPGLYMLKTNDMPIMTTLQYWDHSFESPFKSEIYYVNTTRFTDLNWGTKNPIICRDPKFGPVRIRAYGTYEIKVSDPAKFLSEVVGTDGEFTMDEISYQIRNIITTQFSAAIASFGIPVLDMATITIDLEKLLASKIAPALAEFGLSIPNLYIENISLPPKVEETLDKRTSMGLAGDLDQFMKYSAAEAMSNLDSAAGGSMVAGMGAGMGMAMAQQMNQGPWGQRVSAQPTAIALPPAPVEKVWHTAVKGETKDPFSRAALGRMAANGSLSRETHVWTAGQDGWKPAVDVMELAQLFTVMPPPPPAA